MLEFSNSESNRSAFAQGMETKIIDSVVYGKPYENAVLPKYAQNEITSRTYCRRKLFCRIV